MKQPKIVRVTSEKSAEQIKIAKGLPTE